MLLKPIAFAPLLLTLSLTSLGQITPSTSDVIQQHLRNARQDLQQNRPDLTISELEAVLALDPRNSDAQANLGVLLYFKGEYA
jgi:hypothetical protein